VREENRVTFKCDNISSPTSTIVACLDGDDDATSLPAIESATTFASAIISSPSSNALLSLIGVEFSRKSEE
jgi:hypothetical protein